MKYCINSILGEAFFVHVFIFFHLQDSGRSVLTSNLISIFDGMKVKTENSIINLLYGYLRSKGHSQNVTCNINTMYLMGWKFLFQSLRFPSVLKENKEFTWISLL